MPEILVQTRNNGVPVNALTDPPQITIIRIDTGAAVVSAAAMTDLGSGGHYDYSFVSDPTLEYAFVIDADPNVTGQVTTAERYFGGAFSGNADSWTVNEQTEIRSVLGLTGTKSDPGAAGRIETNILAAITAGGGRTACALISLRDNEFHATLFLVSAGMADTTGTQGRITVYAEDGTVAIAQQTDLTPDAQGMFNISFGPPHNLLTGRNYTCKVEIDSPGGNVVSYQGFSTV